MGLQLYDKDTDRVSNRGFDDDSNDTVKTVLISGFVVAFVIALILFKIFGATDCQPGRCELPVKRHFMVLIDTSDKLAANQYEVVRLRLNAIRNQMDFGDKISIYLLTPETDSIIRPLLVVQKPYDGTQANGVTDGGKRWLGYYKSDFVEPFDAAVKKIADLNVPAKTSPIVRALHKMISLHAKKGVKLELLVVSDSLENSSLLSMYRKYPSFNRVLTRDNGAGSLYLMEVRNKLKRAKVEQYLLYNDKQKRPAFRKWWKAYYTYAGVDTTSGRYIVKTLRAQKKTADKTLVKSKVKAKTGLRGKVKANHKVNNHPGKKPRRVAVQ